jgi:hypothetical protein
MKKALKSLSNRTFKAFSVRRDSWTIVELLARRFYENKSLKYSINNNVSITNESVFRRQDEGL